MLTDTLMLFGMCAVYVRPRVPGYFADLSRGDVRLDFAVGTGVLVSRQNYVELAQAIDSGVNTDILLLVA